MIDHYRRARLVARIVRRKAGYLGASPDTAAYVAGQTHTAYLLCADGPHRCMQAIRAGVALAARLTDGQTECRQ